MKNILPALALIFSINTSAQLTHYYSGFDAVEQLTGWAEYRKGDQGLYKWNISSFGAYTAPNVLAHNYPVGGSTVTDDWYVSPVFDFSAGGMIDSMRYSFSGFGVPNNGDTVAIYLLNGSKDPALATSKILLKDYRGSDYNNDNTWRKQSPITIPAISGQSYIAFRYYTIANWLDLKYDNFSVSWQEPTGIKSADDQEMHIFPNPTKDVLTLKLPADEYNFRLFDLFGKIISEGKFSGSGYKIDVSEFDAGFYFLEIKSAEILYTKKIAIQ